MTAYDIHGINVVKNELCEMSEWTEGFKTESLRRKVQTALKSLERLLTLAKHGKSGKLIQDEFNFGVIHEKDRKNGRTRGDLIGECPGIFEDWIFNKYGDPGLEGLDPNTQSNQFFSFTGISVEQFFDINGREFDHLFVPKKQDVYLSHRQNITLHKDSTVNQVADNIINFIQYKIRFIYDRTKRGQRK